MDRLHFACHVRLNGTKAYVVWYQDDRSGFVRQPDGRLLVAGSFASLVASAATQGISLTPGYVTDYDFDRLSEWCRQPNSEGIDCSTFLNAWNFFDDLAEVDDKPDTPFSRLSREAGGIYDKLFWGNNLAAVTPPGQEFVPTWTADELQDLGRVLGCGIALIEAELRGESSW